MAKKTKPFHPGTGTEPTYFAGRTREWKAVELALKFISAKRDRHGFVPEVEPPIVFIGPRGVGKTVLLERAVRKARKLGIVPLRLRSDGMEETAQDLSDTVGFRGIINKILKLPPVKLKAGIGEDFWVEISPFSNAVHQGLDKSLEKLLKKHPLVILLDEAHTVPAKTMKRLCLSIQMLISANYPIAFILAGTPGLNDLLFDMKATFMERSARFMLNLLSEDEAREAVTQSVGLVGMKIEPNAVDQLVDWSDLYPYFVQVAGDEAWMVAKERTSDTIALADVESGLTNANKFREVFYEARYNELWKSKLHLHAAQVTLLSKRHSNGFNEDDLVAALMKRDRKLKYDDAVRVFEKFLELGFIYKNIGKLEPGIPTLFDYVHDRASSNVKRKEK